MPFAESKKKKKSCSPALIAEHQKSFSNYFKVNCEPVIPSGKCRDKTPKANYISKSFRQIDARVLGLFSLCRLQPYFSPFHAQKWCKGLRKAVGTNTVRPSHQRCSKTQSTSEQLAQIYHHQQAVCDGDAAENSQRLSLPFRTEVKPSAADGDTALTPHIHTHARDKQNGCPCCRRPC